MKSPLAAISGSAELPQEDMAVVDRRRFTNNISRQAGRLDQMIRKLLALADVEQRKRLETSEWVALTRMLEQLLQELKLRACRRSLALQLDESSQERFAPEVQGDPFLLRPDFSNGLSERHPRDGNHRQKRCQSRRARSEQC